MEVTTARVIYVWPVIKPLLLYGIETRS